MKTDEQVFSEWVSDEIKFDSGNFGLQFTRKNFEVFCGMLIDGQRTRGPVFPELDRICKTRDEAQEALLACGWTEAECDAWMLSFLSAQNLAKYSGTDEVAAALRMKAIEAREKMGWSATPYELPEINKGKCDERTSKSR